MNPVQSALARITGIDEIIDLQRTQLEEQNSQLTEQKSELTQIADVMEHLVSDNAMLQRQIEDLDYLNIFDFSNIKEIITPAGRSSAITRIRRLRHDNPLAKQAVKLVVRFTLGKGVQWDLATEQEEEDQNDLPADNGVDQVPSGPVPSPTKLVQIPRSARAAGEAVVPPPVADPHADILRAFWKDKDNRLAFTTHKSMQKMLDDVITDGEKFYACFEGSVEPYVKVSYIPLEEIDLILYDPENRLKPVFYRRRYQELVYDGVAEQWKPASQPKTAYYWDYRITKDEQADLLKKLRIPKSKIQVPKIRHVSINELEMRDGVRGISELYASREWFRVFREFMEGRASINAAAQAISYIRKIKGGPTAVARFNGSLGGKQVGDNASSNELGKLTRPVSGAIYDTNEAVDLNWMKTDTGALNAKEDARMILMSAGAGVGTMVHYFGEGGDANLATAQSMELPMVKSYEDWQQFIEDFLLGWFEYVLRVATEGAATEAVSDTSDGADTSSEEEIHKTLDRVGFTFPPIISQDVVKYTTSWAQIVRDIAPNNKAMKRQAMRAVLAIMGVPNINGIMPQIEAEMAQAELQAQAERQAMIASLNQPPEQPPVAGKVPNAGMSPDMKKMVAGKGIRDANGPKPA